MQVGQTATAFATIINAGDIDATNCQLSPNTQLPVDFFFQTTDPANALVGDPNTPVDIPAGAAQNFIFGLTPTAPITTTQFFLDYACANSPTALRVQGLNALTFSSDADPIPDIIALTTVVDLPVEQQSTALFAVGSFNVGATDALVVSVRASNPELPLELRICLTDVTGACAGNVSNSIFLEEYIGNTAASFAIFVTATGPIPADPANNRIFISFADNGQFRGETSTAVRTVN